MTFSNFLDGDFGLDLGFLLVELGQCVLHGLFADELVLRRLLGGRACLLDAATLFLRIPLVFFLIFIFVAPHQGPKTIGRAGLWHAVRFAGCLAASPACPWLACFLEDIPLGSALAFAAVSCTPGALLMAPPSLVPDPCLTTFATKLGVARVAPPPATSGSSTDPTIRIEQAA